MKNVVFLLAALLLGTGSSRATEVLTASYMTTFGYSNSFVFVENGVSFAVYPDGEFDFYINNRLGVQTGLQVGAAAITFNSGYNYNPYVQYDDFGAVIQVQQVPVFYDYYGRVNRIGNVYLNYRNGRLYRFGGMRIYYNSFGYYNYHVGYINPYNQFYVYRPIHGYFVRPSIGYCMVYPHAYRRYYQPVRYTYYRPYHNNVRRAYARVGQSHKYHNRIERSRVYKNDGRVVARSNSNRSGDYARYSGKETGSKLRTDRASNRSVASSRTVKAREGERNNSRAVSYRKESSAQKRSSSRAARSSAYNKAEPKRKTIVKRSPERTRSARVNQKMKSAKRVTAVGSSNTRSRSKAQKSAQKQPYSRASRRNPR